MSGGSWDYLCWKMEDAANRLQLAREPERRAFGRMMKKYADAMHAIEWVDSGDSSSPTDTDAINDALGKNAKALVLAELVEQAKEITVQLDAAIKEAEQVKP